MSRNCGRRPAEFQDEHYCAGNVTGNFRRACSLRLRGEKMVQRSPLTTRKYIPIITENTNQKHRNGSRLPEPSYRPRSQSFNSTQKPKKSCLKNHEPYMNRNLSMTDSAHTPPGSPEDLPDDESLHSYGSAATAASIDAGYAPFNGTTFRGQPANILAADGRPLDTLDVNVDRAAHYTAKALNGHLLKKRSIVGAPILAAPVAWSHSASLRIPAASVIAPWGVAPWGLGRHW